VQIHLRAWKEDTGNKAWVGVLPDIGLKMNRAVHSSTVKSAYQIMFCKNPDGINIILHKKGKMQQSRMYQTKISN
jgi:hypothetical protein